MHTVKLLLPPTLLILSFYKKKEEGEEKKFQMGNPHQCIFYCINLVKIVRIVSNSNCEENHKIGFIDIK